MSQDIQSLNDNAEALRQAGRPEEARREFRRISEETTDADWKSALLLGEVQCYLDCERFDDADRVLNEIRKLKLNEYGQMCVSSMAACVLGLKGEHKKAALLYKDILQKYQQILSTPEELDTYEDTRFRLAIELASSNDHTTAINHFKEATSFSTLSVEARQGLHFWLGSCYEKLGEIDSAIDEYLCVISFNLHNSSEAEARYYAARLYVRRGGFAQAKHQLDRVLHDYKKTGLSFSLKYIYEMLSITFKHLGEREKEKYYAQRAKKIK